MLVTGEIAEIRKARWSDDGASWGFVPTMGFLHEGHFSLVRRARQENDRVAVSIYVNPTQFAPNEDLAAYPRDLERDRRLLQDEGIDLLFTPSDEAMYPRGFQTTVTLSRLTTVLEGKSRTTHFQGVTTVVTKLFNIIQPTRAYFGQKDAQQAAVIRQLITDLNMDIELVVCPIVREADGLAMSSRNVRLSEEQRRAAPVLFRALRSGAELIESGITSAGLIKQIIEQTISAEPLARIDYVSAADPLTLQELEIVQSDALLSVAVFFGDVRLIDNMLVPHTVG